MIEYKKINDDYLISSTGKVYSLDRTVIRKNGRPHHCKFHMIKQQIDDKGYLRAGVVGKIHKLLAEAFIPNPNNYNTVHHKDHNKLNNSLDNIEWIDEIEHDRHHGGKNTPKKVYQYTTNNELVCIYNSTQEASRANDGFGYSNISRCCRGEQETYKGYKWSYYPL